MSTNAVTHVSYMIKACIINLQACGLILIGYDGDCSAAVFLFLEASKLNAIYIRQYYLHQNWLPTSGIIKYFRSVTAPSCSAFQGWSKWLREILSHQSFLHHSFQCWWKQHYSVFLGRVICRTIWLFAQYLSNSHFPFCGEKPQMESF